MKYFITALIILLAGVAQGATLVADCITGADYFVISGLPSTYNVSKVTPDATGTYAFKVDITAIPEGTYTVTYKACTNLWGCSANSTALTFTRPKLSQPGGACKVIP